MGRLHKRIETDEVHTTPDNVFEGDGWGWPNKCDIDFLQENEDQA